MLSILAALLLVQAPAAAPDARELARGHRLGEAWGRCVNQSTLRYLRSRESVETIVDAVLGSCASQEDAVRGFTQRHYGAAAAERSIADGRRSIRETVTARIMERRTR